MREMMHSYLNNNGISIKNGTDVNSIMRDMMSVLLEGALDERLDEELGYSKYDYRNKDTDNRRNRHSKKKRLCIPAMETWMWRFPVTRMANTSRSLLEVPEYRDTGHRRKNPFHVCKSMTTGDIESHRKELIIWIFLTARLAGSQTRYCLL